MAVDLTTQILMDIRDGIHATNDRLDATNERLDRTNERLDRVVAEQIRHATAIVALEAGQRDIVGALVRLNDNVEVLGARVEVLGARVERLDARLENVFAGALGQTTRQSAERLDALELRVDALERRTG